ncbi:MAG: hypothetical protein NTX22_14000 [Ignavibacteriales bacterium]|nr:hypothetical protein [Ignavibacteriales bacterium]
MGTQQLLYIVLAVIIIAIAILTGMNYYKSWASQSNRDKLYNHINYLSYEAMAHSKKVRQMGGGQGSFSGWKINSKLLKTPDGKFTVTIKAARIDFNALGVEKGYDGKNPVRVSARVQGTKITPRIWN